MSDLSEFNLQYRLAMLHAHAWRGERNVALGILGELRSGNACPADWLNQVAELLERTREGQPLLLPQSPDFLKEILLASIRTAQKGGEFESAVHLLRQARQGWPRDVVLAALATDFFRQQGQFAEALASCTDLAEIRLAEACQDSAGGTAWMEAGYALRSVGRLDDAVMAFVKASNEIGQSPIIAYEIAESFRQAGYFNKAAYHFERIPINALGSELIHNHALSLVEIGCGERALSMLEPDVMRRHFSAVLNRGLVALRSGSFAMATADLSASLKMGHPAADFIQLLRMGVLCQQGALDQARQCAEEMPGIWTGAEMPFYWIYLARYLRNIPISVEFPAAIAKQPPILFARALGLLALGQPDGAAPLFAEVCTMRPDVYAARLFHAISLRMSGDMAGATQSASLFDRFAVGSLAEAQALAGLPRTLQGD